MSPWCLPNTAPAAPRQDLCHWHTYKSIQIRWPWRGVIRARKFASNFFNAQLSKREFHKTSWYNPNHDNLKSVGTEKMGVWLETSPFCREPAQLSVFLRRDKDVGFFGISRQDCSAYRRNSARRVLFHEKKWEESLLMCHFNKYDWESSLGTIFSIKPRLNSNDGSCTLHPNSFKFGKFQNIHVNGTDLFVLQSKTQQNPTKTNTLHTRPSALPSIPPIEGVDP